MNSKPLDNKAPDLFSSYGFTQLIDIPTRVTRQTTSLIDLIFVDSIDNIVSHGTLPQIADHDGTLACFSIEKPKFKGQKKIIYNYNDIDFNGLQDYIKNYNYEQKFFSKDIINQASLLTDFLQEAFNTFFPSKTVYIKANDQPWCNKFTRLLLRKKN